MKAAVLAAAGALLAACATPPNIIAPTQQPNTPDRFVWCGGFGCKYWYTIRLEPAELAQLAAILEPPAKDAAQERDRVALAASLMERLAGPKAGVQDDVGGTMFTDDGPRQLDCFSEASNTTIALKLFEGQGWLRFHRVVEPTMRGYLYGTSAFAVHATATMQEISNGRLWVVDTWFFDNGGPTFVVDRDEWRAGWHPEGGAFW